MQGKQRSSILQFSKEMYRWQNTSWDWDLGMFKISLQIFGTSSEVLRHLWICLGLLRKSWHSQVKIWSLPVWVWKSCPAGIYMYLRAGHFFFNNAYQRLALHGKGQTWAWFPAITWYKSWYKNYKMILQYFLHLGMYILELHMVEFTCVKISNPCSRTDIFIWTWWLIYLIKC